MQSASVREVQRLLRTHGQRGWVEIARRYGKTFRYGPMFVTCEPEVVRALLMERVHAEKRPPIHRLMAAFPGADGIVFMDGEPWLKRTRALMPVFQARNVESFAAFVHETTVAHLARWQQPEAGRDLYAAVQQLGAALILRMGYGLDPDDPRAARLARAMVEYKEYTMRPHPRHRLDEFGVLPSKILALPWILAGLIKLRLKTRRVEAATRDVLAAGGPPHDPSWIRGLQAAGIDGRKLAEDLNHMYTAYNALDYAITAALYELASDHRLSAALRAEMRAVLGDRDVPSREDAVGLKLTQAFILEVLRHYPVTMGAMRLTGKPIDVGGDTIPAGSQVAILLHALHHHPDFWDDPDRLRPERWLASPQPKVPYSYVPFLDGSRKCIGRAMAEMQMLVLLTTIVRRFDLEVHGDMVVPTFMIPRFARPIPFSLVTAAAVAA